MVRKDKKKLPSASEKNIPAVSVPLISKKGWKWIVSGCGTAVVGYVLLSFTDPRGQNWQSFVSPFLILSGYGLMAIGLLIKDTQSTLPS